MLGKDCFEMILNEDNINLVIDKHHRSTRITNKDLYKNDIDEVGKEPNKNERNFKFGLEFSLYNFIFIDNVAYYTLLNKHLNSIDLILAISYIENIITNLVDNRYQYLEYSDFLSVYSKCGYDKDKEKAIQAYTKILFGLYSRVFNIEEQGIDYWYDLGRDIFVATLEEFKGVNFELLDDISSYIVKYYYDDVFYCYSGSDVEKYPIEYITSFLKKTDIIGNHLHNVDEDYYKHISGLLNTFGRLDPYFIKTQLTHFHYMMISQKGRYILSLKNVMI